METVAVATRERRKRVHSAKCSCCSHEQGKAELKARHSRKRKGDEISKERTPVLKTKRISKSSRSTKVADFNSKEDENLTNKGRILRSGRSTPVYVETGGLKEVVVTQKPAPQRKTKVKKKPTKKESSKELVKQEGDVNSDDVKPILFIKTEDLDVHIEKNVAAEKKNEANSKSKKQRNKAANQQPKSLAKAGTIPGIKSVKYKGGNVNRSRRAPNGRTQKVKADSSNVPRNKRSQIAKAKRLNIETTGNKLKKVSAIEKLKVRAFDQLKEKLEIAIDRSSLSVPECAKLLQQITSPNLSEIFYGQPASVDEVSSESLVAELAGKSFPEIMSDGMQKVVLPITKDSAVNLSEAAQALVSFKTQTASATSRMNLDQEAPLSHEINNSSSSVTQPIVKDIQNNGANARFSEHQFVKNNIDDQFDNAISAATQPTGVQLMKSQELQSNNNQLSGSNEISDPHMKSSNSELSTVAFSPSSLFLPVTNQLLQQPIPQSTTNQLLQQQISLSTANPLVPATNQFVHLTNALTPTTNQDFSTINSLLTTTNQAPSLTNSSIPTTNQVLSTINPLLPTVNQVPSSTNPLLSTTNRLVQTNHLQTTINPLIPTTNQLLYNFPSASAAADTAIVAISPALPVVQASNVLPNQPQLTFQLLPPQGIIPTQPTVMTTCQTQATPRSSTATSTTPNRPTTLLTTPLNHLFLPRITPPIDQKTLGSNLPTILPGIQTAHDLLLPKTVGTVTQQHAGTVAATSANDMPPSCKLRPILPRQPLVTNPPQSILKIAGNATNVPNNVKKAVRRLVSGRSKNSDLSTQQTTSLPDIASTFNKGIFTGHVSGPAIVPGQSNTEMANKEQAIKALLSIGSEQQKTAQQEAKGVVNVATSRASEPKKPNDLLVVFDTNKEIFKVDDVIIDPQVNTIGKESYTCGKCSKIFTSLSYLARHIKRVCPDMTHRKWKCDHCDKAFRHPFGLQQHVFTHTGERPHKCSQCPKAFYSSNDLRRHGRIHSGERPYKCKHCGKTFATTISLKTHTFIHTGEKPHRCPHCPKTFATSSKLGRHVVTHSEQRPFACTHCPKTFNRSGDLRRHNLNVHEGKLPAEDVDEKPDTKKILEFPDLITDISKQNIDSEIPI